MTPGDVRRIRDTLAMTQVEFAALLGLAHPSQVAHLENGRTPVRGPLRALLVRVAKEAGFDPEQEGWE